MINHGANSSIGGVPMGSISPKSAIEGIDHPIKPKKHNKRSKKNKGRESQEESLDSNAINV